MSPLPEHVVALHREVQRKFGRNLLRLQQYERLIKALVAEHDIAGTPNDFFDNKAARHESVAPKTLGQVVGALTGNFVAPASISPHSDANDDPPTDLTMPWFRITSRITFSEEKYPQVIKRLADVVELRNELVHHFLEKHDLWSEPGCLAADVFLDECFKLIDSSFVEMTEWAKNLVEGRITAANLINTPEFSDYFVHGIQPENLGVHWTKSTIVNLLQDAESVLARDGWTSLSSAIAYIKRARARHTPSRYGCSSWRHVLHESDLFDIRKERNEGLPTETWYRSSSEN